MAAGSCAWRRAAPRERRRDPLPHAIALEPVAPEIEGDRHHQGVVDHADPRQEVGHEVELVGEVRDPGGEQADRIVRDLRTAAGGVVLETEERELELAAEHAARWPGELGRPLADRRLRHEQIADVGGGELVGELDDRVHHLGARQQPGGASRFSLPCRSGAARRARHTRAVPRRLHLLDRSTHAACIALER